MREALEIMKIHDCFDLNKDAPYSQTDFLKLLDLVERMRFLNGIHGKRGKIAIDLQKIRLAVENFDFGAWEERLRQTNIKRIRAIVPNYAMNPHNL